MAYDDMKVIAGIAGLVLTIIAFALVVIYVYLPSNKKKFDEASRLPLDDRDENSPRG